MVEAIKKQAKKKLLLGISFVISFILVMKTYLLIGEQKLSTLPNLDKF